MTLRIVVVLAASLLLTAGVVCAAATVRATESAGQEAVALPAQAFGFQAGEERRYVLGPQDALRGGEYATWTIRLESVAAADNRYLFALEHERRLHRWHLGWNDYEPESIYAFEGTVIVNRHGFPLEVDFTRETRLLDGGWVETYHRRYVYAEGWYERSSRRVRKNGVGTNRTLPLPDIVVPEEAPVDLEELSGLYLYHASPLTCIGVTTKAPCTGGSLYLSSGGSGVLETAEPMLANPGLLSLLLASSTPPRGDEQAVLLWRSRRRQFPFRVFTFQRLEDTDVALGGRSTRAVRYQISGFPGDVFAQADGKVLKVDIGDHPETHRPRWIRLVLPSEY